MALLLIAFLYVTVGWLLSLFVSFEMSNEVRLAFNLIGGVGTLILPIVIYSYIDLYLTKLAVSKVALNWCHENNVGFVRVELHKNHFVVLYNNDGKEQRKKFRINFIFSTWSIKKVEWLPK